MKKTKIGIIGCGNISGTYLRLAKTFDILEVAAVADAMPERAKAKAAEYGVAKVCTVDELLADKEIDIILNLTNPLVHAKIALAALQAGKSVYNEKPLAVELEDAQRMVKLAKERGLRIGCAPDTFMGAGIQTCRKLLDDGVIGTPIAASAFMMGHGMETWHPDPESFYQRGGGPMFDVGPYYMTALVVLLGPIKRITGSAKISFPEREIGSEPKRGTKFAVTTPTHISGTMDFASGAVGTIITSFDVWKHNMPRIEIYGSEGTLSVPDPNTFGGPVKVFVQKEKEKEWQDVPLMPGRAENARSLGVADMAHAMRSGRQHRANDQLAFHVLEAMHAFLTASSTGKHVELTSVCQRPAPIRFDLPLNLLDD